MHRAQKHEREENDDGVKESVSKYLFGGWLNECCELESERVIK